MYKSKVTMRYGVLLGLVLLMSSLGMAQSIHVIVDGEPVEFSGVRPRPIAGRVMVPLRGVLEKLGAYVDWVPSTQTVIAQRGDIDLELRIGERMAQVNGRTVMLEVPAMTIAGSTMVPLRFMSEALGADVRWDNATRTVMITTDMTGRGPRPVPVQEGRRASRSVTITSFRHNARGWLGPGDTIELVMEGTDDGTAHFQIPGAVQEVQMREVRSGRYVGNWTVPRGKAMTVARANVIGFLHAYNREQRIEAGELVYITTGAI